MTISVFRFIILAIAIVLCGAANAKDSRINTKKLLKKDWIVVESSNFIITTDYNEKIAKNIIQELENFRFFLAYIGKIEVLSGLPPLPLLVLSNKISIKDLGVPNTVGGYFSASISHPYAVVDMPSYSKRGGKASAGKVVLFHEYVHFLERRSLDLQFIPHWLQEGRADYLASFYYDDKEMSIGDTKVLQSRFYGLKNNAGNLKKVDIEKFIKKYHKTKPNGEDRKEWGKFYSASFFLIHYLYASDSRKSQLNDYLDLINKGFEIDDAFVRAFKTSYEEMSVDFNRYVSGWKIYKRVYNLEGVEFKFPIVKTTVRRLEGEDKYQSLALYFFGAGYVSKENKLLAINKMLKEYPNNAELLYYRARYNGSYTSTKELEKILEVDPQHRKTLSRLGELYLNKAELYKEAGFDKKVSRFVNLGKKYSLKVLKVNQFDGDSMLRLAELNSLLGTEAGIKLALAAYDSASVYAKSQNTTYYYKEEAKLHMLNNDNLSAANLMKKARIWSRGTWYDHYGLFLLNSLELRKILALESIAEKQSYIYKDGSEYLGGWKNGGPHGTGVLKGANGAIYKGDWVDGFLHGNAEFVASNGYIYNGEFTEGRLTGRGNIVHKDNESYTSQEGFFENGYEQGLHTMRYHDGSTETGEYIRGYQVGSHTRVDKAGNSEIIEYVLGRAKTKVNNNQHFLTWTDKGKENDETHGICVDTLRELAAYCQLGDLKNGKVDFIQE